MVTAVTPTRQAMWCRSRWATSWASTAASSSSGPARSRSPTKKRTAGPAPATSALAPATSTRIAVDAEPVRRRQAVDQRGLLRRRLAGGRLQPVQQRGGDDEDEDEADVQQAERTAVSPRSTIWMTTPAAAYPGSSLTTRARIPRAIVAAYGVLVPVSRSFQTTSASSHAAVTQSRNVKAANAPASPHTCWSWGTSSNTSPAQMSPIARPRPVGMLPVPSIRASCVRPGCARPSRSAQLAGGEDADEDKPDQQRQHIPLLPRRRGADGPDRMTTMPWDLTADTIVLLRAAGRHRVGEPQRAADRRRGRGGAAAAAAPRVSRHGNTVVARTDLGRGERVVIAGHLDTVPINANLPRRARRRRLAARPRHVRHEGRGRGDAASSARDGGRAQPRPDLLFYDSEEIEAESQRARPARRERPGPAGGRLRDPDGAHDAVIEAGCQGTLRVDVTDPRRAGPLAPGPGGRERDPRGRRDRSTG